LLAVSPIILNNGEIGGIGESLENTSKEENTSEGESDNLFENTGWNVTDTNFKNLTLQNKTNYIQNQIELKGLTVNQFLIDYFISAILINTSGIKFEVDTFLNINLTTIMNDRRAIQLGVNSFVRFKPFLLNNSCESFFSKPLPYKSDDAFKFDLQDELSSMTEAHKIAEYGVVSINDNNNN
jgi:hypothetical protein